MITSIHNPKVQVVRKLQSQARVRREEQSFIVEGIRLAEESFQAGWVARQVFYTDELDARGKKVVEELSARGTPFEQVSAPVMKAISDTDTPQGILVILSQRTLPLPTRPDFMLILDGIRDPGNLGTALRSAAAAGVQGVLLAPGCVDAWSPKVLRAGMGAHFHLPIHSLGWQEIRQILKSTHPGFRFYLADSAGGVVYTQADFRSPFALIIGGEATGASTDAVALADRKVHIPMPGGIESLNAGIAASILLFEAVRQRGA